MRLRNSIRYFLFNAASTLLVLLIAAAARKWFSGNEDPVKTAALYSAVHAVFSLLLRFLILIRRNFHYEFFTYCFLVASVIAIGTMIFDFAANYPNGIVGVTLLSAGLFSRLCLWKYDLAQLEEKG